MPRSSPQLLPDHLAQGATNTKLWSGALDKFNDPAFYYDPSKAGNLKTIYRFGAVPGNDLSGFWFHWTQEVHCVRGPVKGDTQERTYFTGDGVPQSTDASIATAGGTDYPTNSYDLGVPSPPAGLSVAVSGASGAPEDATNRAYAVTYVSALGEEGPPSPLTGEVQFWEGQTVTLTLIPLGPGGNLNIGTKRIYRTATGASTELDFVVELPVSDSSYIDVVLDSQLGESIQSVFWEAPPSDMVGIGAMANGLMYGFSKNLVCVSEAWLPHAWNPLNQQATNHPIIAGGHFDNTIVALTTKNPYLITGYDPRSLTMQEYDIGQGCVSARSAVNSKYGVAYASPDGLMLVGPGGYKNLTDPFMTKDQWQELTPESILGVVHEDRYFGFYDNGATQGCFLLDPNNLDVGLVYLDIYATGAFSDPMTDKLYLLVNNQIMIWDEGVAAAYLWKSKVFRTGRNSLTACRILADTYTDLVFRLYINGVIHHTETVTSDRPFRMPGGADSILYEFDLVGTDVVNQVALTSTPSELAFV